MNTQTTKKSKTSLSSGESCITGGGRSSSSESVSGEMTDMLDSWEKEFEDSDQVVVAHELDRYLTPLRSLME